MKMNFWEKSENVMFLHSLRLSFMQKIRKIYRAVFWEKKGNRERETERDGPEYKGPPDAIAKPSDQKRMERTANETFLQHASHRYPGREGNHFFTVGNDF